MKKHAINVAVAMSVLVACGLGVAAQTVEPVDLEAIQRLKEEGFERSQVMDIAWWLTEAHGPRLTNSPQMRAAADWAVAELGKWGLSNVKREPWGQEFGRGWSNERTVVHVLEPAPWPVIAYARAWTPGTGGPITAAAVASVIKVLLAMRHRQLPPTLHFARLNEHIELRGTPRGQRRGDEPGEEDVHDEVAERHLSREDRPPPHDDHQHSHRSHDEGRERRDSRDRRHRLRHVAEERVDVVGEDPFFAFFRGVGFDDAHAAEGFSQPPGHGRVELAPLAEEQTNHAFLARPRHARPAEPLEAIRHFDNTAELQVQETSASHDAGIQHRRRQHPTGAAPRAGQFGRVRRDDSAPAAVVLISALLEAPQRGTMDQQAFVRISVREPSQGGTPRRIDFDSARIGAGRGHDGMDLMAKCGKPVVSASILGFDGQISTFVPHEGPCYRCLYPVPPPPELAPSCGANGVLGVMAGVMGLLQANEVIKLVAGIGEPLVGRLLLYESLGTRFTELKVKRDPRCPICGPDAPEIAKSEMGRFPDYELFCGAPAREPSPA